MSATTQGARAVVAGVLAALAFAGCCLTFDGSRFACASGSDCPPELPDCAAGFCGPGGTAGSCATSGQACSAGEGCCAASDACTALDGGSPICCGRIGQLCFDGAPCCPGSTCSAGQCL